MNSDKAVNARQKELFEQQESLCRLRIDVFFNYLLPLQWLVGLVYFFTIMSVRSHGEMNSSTPAFLLQLLLTSFTIALTYALARSRSGEIVIRLSAAISQIMISLSFFSLGIGRTGMQLHILASLVFIALYRDLRILMVAGFISILGLGLLDSSQPIIQIVDPSTNWIESSFFITLELILLVMVVQSRRREMRLCCKRTVDLETAIQEIERTNNLKTAELKRNYQELDQIRLSAIHQAQMASLSSMAAGVAHEINNPLAIIYARTKQQKRLLESSVINRADISNFLVLLEKEVDRIRAIINSLRLFSNLPDPGIVEIVEIEQLINDAANLCAERMRALKVDLSVRNEIPGVVCSGKRVELLQVLLSLLDNACEAVEHRKDGKVAIYVTGRSNFIVVSISDNGPGVDIKIREKIMFPFFTTKEIGKGAGLGLAVAKGIVERHGGRLWLEEQSADTKFCFSLQKTFRADSVILKGEEQKCQQSR